MPDSIFFTVFSFHVQNVMMTALILLLVRGAFEGLLISTIPSTILPYADEVYTFAFDAFLILLSTLATFAVSLSIPLATTLILIAILVVMEIAYFLIWTHVQSTLPMTLTWLSLSYFCACWLWHFTLPDKLISPIPIRIFRALRLTSLAVAPVIAMFFLTTWLYHFSHTANVWRIRNAETFMTDWSHGRMNLSFAIVSIVYPVFGTFMRAVLWQVFVKFAVGKFRVDIRYMLLSQLQVECMIGLPTNLIIYRSGDLMFFTLSFLSSTVLNQGARISYFLFAKHRRKWAKMKKDQKIGDSSNPKDVDDSALAKVDGTRTLFEDGEAQSAEASVIAKPVASSLARIESGTILETTFMDVRPTAALDDRSVNNLTAPLKPPLTKSQSSPLPKEPTASPPSEFLTTTTPLKPPSRLFSVLNTAKKQRVIVFQGKSPGFKTGCQSITTFCSDWLQRDTACITMLLYVTWASWSHCNVRLDAPTVLLRHAIATGIGVVCSSVGVAVDVACFGCDVRAGARAFRIKNTGISVACVGLIVAYLVMPFLASEISFVDDMTLPGDTACFTPGRRPVA